MSKQLRVLQIVTTMNRGGLETFIMNMYRNIDRSQIQFDFLAHRDFIFDYEDEINSLGGRIYRIVPVNPISMKYRNSLNIFFKNHPYEIVHSHLDCMNAFPLSAAKENGTRVRIAHSHSSFQDKDIKYPIKLLCKKKTMKVATHLFACSEAAGEWMFEGCEYTTVPNGIPVDEYSYDLSTRASVRQEFSVADSTFLIGQVGRFCDVKNHMFTIKVFSELLKLRDCFLLLIGDGILRNDIQRECSRLGILDKVYFLGVREDVPRLMQGLDCILMPSKYEGFPLTLLEAQASGLACLISDNVSPECVVNPSLMKRISLNRGAQYWANYLSDCLAQLTFDRNNAVEFVKKAGYDAVSESNKLQSFYVSV